MTKDRIRFTQSDPKFWQLSPEDRRQVIDHLTAQDADFGQLPEPEQEAARRRLSGQSARDEALVAPQGPEASTPWEALRGAIGAVSPGMGMVLGTELGKGAASRLPSLAAAPARLLASAAETIPFPGLPTPSGMAVNPWPGVADELASKIARAGEIVPEPRVPTMADISSPGDFGSWLAAKAGQSAPDMAAAALATLLGGPLAGGAASAAIQSGDVRERMIEETGAASGPKAIAAGTLMGALDVLPIGRAINRIRTPQLKSRILGYIGSKLTSMGKGALEEATTETLQQLTERAAVDWISDEFETLGPGAKEELTEAFGAGLFLGGAANVGARVQRGKAEPQAAPPPPDMAVPVPRPAPTEQDVMAARVANAPEWMSVEQATQWASGDLTAEDTAKVAEMQPQEVEEQLSAASAAADEAAGITGPVRPAMEAASDAQLAVINRVREQYAAAADQSPALAGEVRIVTPTTKFERGITKMARDLGRDLVLYEGPVEFSSPEAASAGIMGISDDANTIAIDVRGTPETVVAQVLTHELTHQVRQQDAEAWQMLAEDVKALDPEGWQAAEQAVLSVQKLEGANLNDEVLATVAQRRSPTIWRALTNRAQMEAQARPAPAKRLIQWAHRTVRKVARSIGLKVADVDYTSKRQLAELSLRVADSLRGRMPEQPATPQAPAAAMEAQNRREIAGRRQEAQPMPTGAQERRVAARRVSEMSQEELAQRILVDELTGLKSKVAFKEDQHFSPAPAVASFDLDTLKWINDNLGHETGDRMLQFFGEAMKRHTDRGYHISGDEFVVTGETEAEVRQVAERVREQLGESPMVYVAPDGSRYEVTIGFSYGVGEDLAGADIGLAEEKAAREASGARAARGEQPAGLAVVPPEGREAFDRAAEPEPEPKPEPEQVAEPPQGPETENRPVSQPVDQQGTQPVTRAALRQVSEAMGDSARDAEASAWSFEPETRAELLARKLIDRFNRVKTLENVLRDVMGEPLTDEASVYLAEELAGTKIGNQVEAFHDGRVRPLFEAMVAEDVSPKDLEQYLYARHAFERNAHAKLLHVTRPLARLRKKLERARTTKVVKEVQARIDEIEKMEQDKSWPGAGMSDAEAQAALEALREKGLVSWTGEGAKARYSGRLAKLAERVDKITGETLNRLVDNGLVSSALASDLRAAYRYYVPLKGRQMPGDIDDISRPFAAPRGRGYDTRGKDVRRALGRRSRAPNPILAQVILDAESSIDRSERNVVGKRLLSLAREFPNSEVWRVNPKPKKFVYSETTGEARLASDHFRMMQDPHFFAVHEHGEVTFIEIFDARLASAMKNLGTENVHRLLRLNAHVVRAMAALNTSLNAAFIASNFIRDLSTAAINLSEEDLKPIRAEALKGVPGAIAGIWAHEAGKTDGQWARAYAEFKEDGGNIGFFGLKDIGEQARAVQRELARLKPGPVGASRRSVRKLFTAVMAANTGVENGVRLSTYMAARNHGVSRQRAASIAKNLTVNFNRKGEIGTMLNSLYMFANAGIQGNARLVGALLRSKSVRKTAAAIVSASAVLALYNRAIAGDDDDGINHWDKLDPYIKERYLVFMLPEGKRVQLPLPYGYNILNVLGVQAERMVAGAAGWGPRFSPVRSGVDVADAVFGAFNPLDQAPWWDDKGPSLHGLMKTMAPTYAGLPIDLMVDLVSNKAWFGGRIKPVDPTGRKPGSELYFRGATPVSKAITRWLNEATGGSKHRRGLLSVSPEDLDYVVTSLGGGASRTFIRGGQALLGWAGVTEPMPPSRIPFVSTVYGETSPWSTADIYYEILDDLKSTRDEAKGLGSASDRERKLWQGEHAWKLPLVEAMTAIDKAVSNARKKNDDAETERLQKRLIKLYLNSEERHGRGRSR